MNIPNLLTLIRIALVPVFIYFCYNPSKNSILYAIIILAISGVTDILDGYIARKYDQITKLGTVLDPIADKFLTFAILIVFVNKKLIPRWFLIILAIKEIVLILGGIYLFLSEDKEVVSANKFGKIATFFFYLTIFSIVFKQREFISNILIIITIFLHIIALVSYAYIFTKIANRTNKV